MHLDEPVDISIFHPIQYKSEYVIIDCHSQQRQHILVVKGPPHYSLPAEPLHNHSQLTGMDFWQALGSDSPL